MRSFSPWPAFEKKLHKIQEMFGFRYNKQPWLARAKWRTTTVIFHIKAHNLTDLPYSWI